MTFSEDELIPLSALQHMAYCPRQCALIHVEGAWSENRLTVEGRQLHDRVHDQGLESRGDLRIARGLAIRSLELGLSGKTDVVEFHRAEDDSAEGACLPGLPGRWRPFPVEYKRGKPKRDDCDLVQLCAQAMCLEEMLETGVPRGALFYGRTRRRLDVTFTPELRDEVRRAAQGVREIIRSGRLPPPAKAARCRRCSLRDVCLPGAARKRSAAGYLRRMIDDANEEA